MTTQIRKPPYNEQYNDTIPWGAPKKGITTALAFKSNGLLDVSSGTDGISNACGGVSIASVGIIEIGPPTYSTILNVTAHVTISLAIWNLLCNFSSAKAWGKLALEITSIPTGQQVRTEEVVFDKSGFFTSDGDTIKNKKVTLSAQLPVDPAHTYRATLYATVEALAGGIEWHDWGFTKFFTGSHAAALLSATVDDFTLVF